MRKKRDSSKENKGKKWKLPTATWPSIWVFYKVDFYTVLKNESYNIKSMTTESFFYYFSKNEIIMAYLRRKETENSFPVISF